MSWFLSVALLASYWQILKERFGMVAPDVQIEDGKGTILISSEEGETEGKRGGADCGRVAQERGAFKSLKEEEAAVWAVDFLFFGGWKRPCGIVVPLPDFTQTA